MQLVLIPITVAWCRLERLNNFAIKYRFMSLCDLSVREDEKRFDLVCVAHGIVPITAVRGRGEAMVLGTMGVRTRAVRFVTL